MSEEPDEGLPLGWLQHDPFESTDNRPVACPSCDWRGRENELTEDAMPEEIIPGWITPVGACPHLCGPVYYADVQVAWRVAPGLLDQIAEAARDTSVREDDDSEQASSTT